MINAMLLFTFAVMLVHIQVLVIVLSTRWLTIARQGKLTILYGKNRTKLVRAYNQRQRIANGIAGLSFPVVFAAGFVLLWVVLANNI